MCVCVCVCVHNVCVCVHVCVCTMCVHVCVRGYVSAHTKEHYVGIPALVERPTMLRLFLQKLMSFLKAKKSNRSWRREGRREGVRGGEVEWYGEEGSGKVRGVEEQRGKRGDEGRMEWGRG